MAVDPYWTVAGTHVDGLVDSPTPTWDWGQTTTLSFIFEAESSSGTAHTTRYASVLDYVRSASLASVEIYDTQGRPRYEERLPSAAPESSLVIALEPSGDVIDVDAIWAIVTGGQDESQPVSGDRRLALELVPLALHSTYATRSDVDDALGTGIS